MAVGVAIAGVSAAASIVGGVKARNAAKRAAREQANLTREKRTEEIRQLRQRSATEKALARATVYGSGIRMSGSPAAYVRALDMENQREIAYARRAQELEYRAIRKGAAGAGASLFAQGINQALNAAATAYANRQAPNMVQYSNQPATGSMSNTGAAANSSSIAGGGGPFSGVNRTLPTMSK